jgi:hypothetical protein
VALLIRARPKSDEWGFAARLLVVGFACWGATALARRVLCKKADTRP